MKVSNIVLLSLIGLGIIISFSFIYAIKKEVKVIKYSEIEGNELLETKVMEVKDFHSIHAKDQMKVVLFQGDFKVEVSAENNLLEYIIVENVDGVLDIRRKFDTGKFIKQKVPMIVRVTAPDFKEIKASNQSEIIIDNELKGNNMVIKMEGQSNLKGQFNVTSLDLTLTQQSNADILGTSSNLLLDMSDQSGIRAKSLVIEKAEIEMRNQTNAILNVTSSISGRVRNNADVTVRGGAENMLEKSSMASIKIR